MADRRDLQPDKDGFRPLSYTCGCGWIDWGHATPGGPEELRRQLRIGRSAQAGFRDLEISFRGRPAFVVDYGQRMHGGPFKLSTDRHWVVRSGLSWEERERAGLGIFLTASVEFEAMQGRYPQGLVSGHSSFSHEDLVSNLVSFFAAFRNIPLARLRTLCGEVSVQESRRLWDEHMAGRALKSRWFHPRRRYACAECTPGDERFPALFSSIRPAEEGTSWTRMKQRRLVRRNPQFPIDVSADGGVSVRRPASSPRASSR